MLDFGTLYGQYAPDVYRFALYLSGDPATAEDLTAETFVRIWTAQDLRVSTVRAYLFAIVRNLYRQSLRTKRREAPLDPTMSDPSSNAETAASENERRHWLMNQLLALAEIDRTVLLMRIQH